VVYLSLVVVRGWQRQLIHRQQVGQFVRHIGVGSMCAAIRRGGAVVHNQLLLQCCTRRGYGVEGQRL
jgi:hypothetical protein